MLYQSALYASVSPTRRTAWSGKVAEALETELGGYDADTPLWYGIACFMTSVTNISVMLAWLRLRSDSLWPAVLYHTVHNLDIQGIFDGSTIATGPTKWITTEFGIGLASVSVLIAIYFWRRRAELTSETAVAAVRRHNQPT